MENIKRDQSPLVKSKALEDLSDQAVYSRLRRFPSTRYYGSKRRLLPFIYEVTKNIGFRTVLDGFGGTASVSLLFKAMGKDVSYHDALLWNSISASVLLDDALPLYDLDLFSEFWDGVRPFKGFVAKTFGGLYYTDEENEWLDGAIAAIQDLESPRVRRMMLYCLFQACLRKRPYNLFHRANLYMRTKEGVRRSFGNKTTWDMSFSSTVKRIFLDLTKGGVWPGRYKAKVLASVDIEDVPQGYDLVYLDPPYVKERRYDCDYLKKYHFLEGLASYDVWPDLIDHKEKTKCLRPRDHIRKWQQKKRSKDSLFGLIEKHKDSVVVLSYVEGAYPSIKQILSHFKQNFSQVVVEESGLVHALSSSPKKEVLLVGMP